MSITDEKYSYMVGNSMKTAFLYYKLSGFAIKRKQNSF